MALRGLADRVVIVTGGASGIGRATCARLTAEGAYVAVVDRAADNVAATVSELGDERTLGVVADVSVAEDVDRYVSATVDRFGRLDGLFNNAGLTAPMRTVAESDPADFERLIRVNVLGVYLGMRRALREFIAAGRPGVLLNTSSGLALHGSERQSMYAATKAAIVSLTRTAALEAAPHQVRVNAILPGPTMTPMLGGVPDDLLKEYAAAVPLGRFGKPAEIAAAAAWLLSDESSFVTGGIYSVDGGEGA